MSAVVVTSETPTRPEADIVERLRGLIVADEEGVIELQRQRQQAAAEIERLRAGGGEVPNQPTPAAEAVLRRFLGNWWALPPDPASMSATSPSGTWWAHEDHDDEPLTVEEADYMRALAAEGLDPWAYDDVAEAAAAAHPDHIRCPKCRSLSVTCHAKPHRHECHACGYDGTGR